MRILKVIFIGICFCLTFCLAYAAEDGFGAAREIKSQHFVVSYDPELDSYLLLEKLNIGPADLVFSDRSSAQGDSLAVALDALYSIVMQALDMNLYSLQGNLKICKDRNQLNNVYESMFGHALNARSFYVSGQNTIYISADDFTKEVLGHEIAHMIISNYFVVQPPQRAAEILSGYVEYQLRKSSR